MSEIERAIAYWEEFEREIDEMPHSEILEAQREPVRTALTVLRAELEREKNPLTWNEHINQMTVEEKAVFFSELFNCATCPIIEECQHDCNTMLTKWLNSPYTEGAAK